MRDLPNLAAVSARTARRVLTLLHGDDVGRRDGRCRLPPEWLVLVVNNFCNLHCRMCDVGLGETGSVFWAHMIGDDRRNMSLELFDEILEQGAEFVPRPRLGLAFTEPLIHPRIVEMVARASAAGFRCSVTSNGSTLARLADGLVRAGLDEITVSLDGPEEVHDRIRGRRGSYAAAVDGIARLAEAKTALRRRAPRLRLSYTIVDANATAMVTFVEAVRGLGPESINFAHFNFVSDSMAMAHNAVAPQAFRVARSNLGPIEPDRLDLDAMWAALAELTAVADRADCPPIRVVPAFTTRADLESYYREPHRFIGGRVCSDPWRIMMVRTDGTVVPAHSRCYNVRVGSVREQRLAEIWSGRPFTELRRTLAEAGGSLPACARCCGATGKAGAPA